MKRSVFLALVVAMLFFSSCAFHDGLTNNFNHNNTTVELSKKNFRVVDYVKGEASCTYVFGIGGLGKGTLVEKAKARMYKKADLMGEARTVANISVDTRYSFFPIIRKMTVTASGHVIQFEGH